MEKKRHIPKNRIMRTAVVLLLLVMVTSHLASGMLARYRVTAGGSDSARVAVFEITTPGSEYVAEFSFAMDPDSADQHCAQIVVVNNSETDVRCEVTVQTTGNLPLEFYTKSDSESVDHVDLDTNGDQATLELYADWLDESDSYLYHREMDHVIVTVTCVQID